MDRTIWECDSSVSGKLLFRPFSNSTGVWWYYWPGKIKLFKFLNFLTENEGSLQIVDEAWKLKVQVTAMFIVWQKLRYCKEPLKRLKDQGLGSDSRINTAREQLSTLQSQITINIDPDIMEQEKLAAFNLNKWLAYKKES
ncbi:hypothetical protein HAX54_016345 [Datura stramonium]|uniref:Uncharacterized protein n=1 Tax=Datura stramonium TaxID=4076 RepID=A0ABS8UJE6_DATST|nr:hypothetical protein [Datura stramonium]